MPSTVAAAIKPDIILRDGDSGFELMRSGQGFDHGCGEVVTKGAVPML